MEVKVTKIGIIAISLQNKKMLKKFQFVVKLVLSAPEYLSKAAIITLLQVLYIKLY